jgi:hypothetical protein
MLSINLVGSLQIDGYVRVRQAAHCRRVWSRWWAILAVRAPFALLVAVFASSFAEQNGHAGKR